MSNMTFAFLVAVLAAMPIQNSHAAGGDLPDLTCMEAHTVPVVTSPANVTCDKFNFDFRIIFHCKQLHRTQKGDEWMIDMKFSQLNLPDGKSGTKDSNGSCGSIHQITGTAPHLGSRYQLNFSPDLVIGLSDGVCDLNLTHCRYQMQMRADVAALSLFTYTPDELLFWNCSSPLLRPELGWLVALDAQAAVQEHYPFALPGLAGSSVENITLMGSFGTDEKGQLPHLNNLGRLKSLIITDNPMEDLTSEDIANSAGIRRLHLIKNKFHKIPTAIAELKNLSELIFESITQNFTFYPETLDELNKLETLILSGTRIEHWTGLFKSLRSLQSLNLSRCKIKSFSAHGSNFPELRYLNLRENFLTSLLSNAFAGLDKLSTIDLSKNFLSQLPPDIFVSGTLEPWISFVNLSNNHIAIFSQAMLASLSALQEVDIGANMIACGDCQASQLQHWLDGTKTIVKNLGQTAPVACYQPPKYNGTLVQLVNFDDVCYIPRRLLWLGIGAPTAGVIAIVAIGGVLFYYRTEVVYLAHLAKVRATSKKKKRTQDFACYDAFVCYSGKNRKWVMRRLVPILERRPESYVLCLFDRDFRLGSQIVTNIVESIDQSRKVIVVLTQHFVDSKWCQWELEMAQHKLFSEDRDFLVLLELEPLERRRLPRLLRFLLDTRPVVRWPRPETAPAVLAAAKELRRALGPSLRQCLIADPAPMDEPRSSSSGTQDRTLLLQDAELPARL